MDKGKKTCDDFFEDLRKNAMTTSSIFFVFAQIPKRLGRRKVMWGRRWGRKPSYILKEKSPGKKMNESNGV